MNQKATLTEGSIIKGVCRFSIPILLSNLFQQLYNSVDTAIVGKYAGAASLAAVGSTGTMLNLIIGFFLGIATGAGVLYAMRFGAGDKPGLKKLINNSLIIGVIAAVIVTIIGVTLSASILCWMHSPEDVFPLAKKYLKILFLGVITTILYNIGAGLIRAGGDSKRPMLYLIIGGLTNFILDYIFVKYFHWGVVGAAWATVIAQAVSAVLVITRLTKLDPEYALCFKDIKWDSEVIVDIIKIAVPSGLQGSIINLSGMIIQAKYNLFGTAAVAGVSAYGKIDGFVYMPILAINFATSTFVGQNYGAKNYSRIRKGIRTCLILSIICSVSMGILIILFIEPLLQLFTDDAEAISYGIRVMWYMAPFAFAFNPAEILGGAIRGSGQAAKVTMISAFFICVLRIIWIYTMMNFYPRIETVFVSYPIGWFACSIAMIIFYFKGSNLMKTIKNAQIN